ncbi:MAG TPA: rod shape-determining protein MreC [Gaiellaceae bacterium]|nr:rod shape-determining protein MreC [Gaiellaceae bacterium]
MPRNRTVRLAVLGSSVQRAAPSGFPSSRSSALKRRIVVGGLVLLALVLITVSFRSTALDGVQSTGATVLKPFEVAADRVTRPFRDTVGWFHGLVNARSDNKKLRAENQQLRHQLILSQSAIYENVQLRKELHYNGPPSTNDFQKVFASVQANPQGPLAQTVEITAGSSAGVTKGSVVVEPTGGANNSGALIGIVDKVATNVSRVVLLTAADSAVTATDVSDPSVVGIVKRGGGSSGTLILDQVPKKPYVGIGDTIITAGSFGSTEFPSKFPRGIPIGKVTSHSIGDASLFQNIQVTPLVDLTSIQSVVVLVPKAGG